MEDNNEDTNYNEPHEKALILAVFLGQSNRQEFDEQIRELIFLTHTGGGQCVKTFVQNRESIHPKWYLGKGKVEEIDRYIKNHNTDLVITNDDLSPAQIRNLEALFQVKIIDRSGIILHIFARNARTNRAKIQVELAQNQYLLPRLTRLWTHLSKQKGGIGMKGPGEREIETDRRVIRAKISRLKSKLASVDQQSKTQRKWRKKQIRISLVGYTNVGKSSLMNVLTKSDVLAQNKLFATLDSTTRKVFWANSDYSKQPHAFLLSDTVGFIRKLPHGLIESFKSTLDEVLESDLLLHVVDISNHFFEHQMEVVTNTLQEIGLKEKPIVTVFNKIDDYEPQSTSEDIFEDESIKSVTDFKKFWMAKEMSPSVFVSAKTKEGMNDLIFEIKRQIDRLVKN
ncbi:MAG: GTPase HflX [Bacteroidota bacterium]|nr:GTPase HflX [Bacteroidota bacterium]